MVIFKHTPEALKVSVKVMKMMLLIFSGFLTACSEYPNSNAGASIIVENHSLMSRCCLPADNNWHHMALGLQGLMHRHFIC
jgi:hypothetical protein